MRLTSYILLAEIQVHFAESVVVNSVVRLAYFLLQITRFETTLFVLRTAA